MQVPFEAHTGSQVLLIVNFNSNSNMDMEVLMWVGLTRVFMSNLTHCSFRHNNLTDTGAIVLARALQNNKSLEELE